MDKRKIFKIMCLMSVVALFCLFVGLPSALSGKYDVQVHKLQRRLKQLGYNPGKIDGLWGGTTEQALKKFQKDNQLVANGKLDTETSEKLKLQDVKIGDGKYFACTNDGGCTPVPENILSGFEEHCRIDDAFQRNGLVGTYWFDCSMVQGMEDKTGILVSDSYSKCMKLGKIYKELSEKNNQ